MSVRDSLVTRSRQIAEPPSCVSSERGYSWHDLALDADLSLPVVRPHVPTVNHRGVVVGGARRDLSKCRVLDGSAIYLTRTLGIRGGIEQVAIVVWVVIAVVDHSDRRGPSSSDVVHAGLHRVGGACNFVGRADHVAAYAALHCCLPITEHIPHHTESGIGLLPVRHFLDGADMARSCE